jgi:hypothetical protein
MAGNETRVQSVVDAGLIPLIISFLDRGPSYLAAQTEAIRAISNATVNGSFEHVHHMVGQGGGWSRCLPIILTNCCLYLVITPLCKLVELNGVEVVRVPFENMLQKSGTRINEVFRQIAERGGLFFWIHNN